MKEIVLGIPGQWSNYSEIFDFINRNNEWSCSKSALIDLKADNSFRVEIYKHQSDLRDAFELAGQQSLDKKCLKALESHTYTFYLIAPGGSIKLAQSAMVASEKVLRSGGIAIKVESSGLAHSYKDWLALANQRDIFSTYKAFVTLISGDGIYYTCGMHNFGYRDAILDEDIHPNNAAQVLEDFILYNLYENPTFYENDSFSVGPEAQSYRLTREKCDLYPTDSLFKNPHGMWKLTPL